METSYQLQSNLLSDQIYDALRKRILIGDFSPGERLVETDLARQFNVSQAPVRDALRKLGEVGLVRQIPRRGTFVEGVSAKAAVDAFHIRAALEPVAARDLLDRVDGELLHALSTEADNMLKSADAGDLAGVLESDIAFHRIVWWKSENELLPKVWPLVEKIWPLLEARVRNSADRAKPLFFGDLREVALTHVPLIEALKTRDPNTPELFRKHVTQVWSRLEDITSTGA